MFFYSLNGQQTGPVTEAQLAQLLAAGTISSDTLVWREGMADWQPLGRALPHLTGSGTVQCSVCKQEFPVDQTIRYGNSVVCATCKPQFVQRLREGAVDPAQNERLYKIAVEQRHVLLCFLVQVVFNVGQVAARTAPLVGLVAGMGGIVMIVIGAIFVYRLAKALGYAAILYAVAMIIPCINLLTLLVLVSRATSALKQGGVKVGLLGVNRETLERLRAS